MQGKTLLNAFNQALLDWIGRTIYKLGINIWIVVLYWPREKQWQISVNNCLQHLSVQLNIVSSFNGCRWMQCVWDNFHWIDCPIVCTESNCQCRRRCIECIELDDNKLIISIIVTLLCFEQMRMPDGPDPRNMQHALRAQNACKLI